MLRRLALFAAFAIAFSAIAGHSSAQAYPDVSTAGYTDTCSCDYYSPIPFYRSYNADDVDHFYTTNLSEADGAVSNGWAREGTAGRVLSANQTGAIPLFRLWGQSVSDHFYTVSTSRRATLLAAGGWTDQGIAAYILEEPACGAMPFHMTYNDAHHDHFYTTSTAGVVDAVTQHGYIFESTIGYIWPA